MSDAQKSHAGPQPERLHKFLASTGAGSRRECETFIKQGRVSVNGKTVTKMGVKVTAGEDVVMFDGERVSPERKVYYLLNKPSGYICTNSDEKGRPRAMDLVPDRHQRIYTVGRLDAESRGLILLTNDGTIANIICHPRYRVEKCYHVVVRGRVGRRELAKLESGVWLAEGKSSPASVKQLAYDPKRGDTLLEMTLFEGRNREIRRVFAKVGMKVRRLLRTRIGPLELGTLAPGQSLALGPADLRFVHEAERLYEANKELWDAELPQQERGRRPRGTGGSPRRGRGGHGGRRTSRPQGGGRGGQGARGGHKGASGRPARGGGRGGGRDGGRSGGRDDGRRDERGPGRGGRRGERRDGPRDGQGGDRPPRRGRRYYR
ncbi:MAG: pseudouridine synthase [Planctomycetota bacterium]|nr:pseudouridine synthase [Planctomycetota bacterium]